MPQETGPTNNLLDDSRPAVQAAIPATSSAKSLIVSRQLHLQLYSPERNGNKSSKGTITIQSKHDTASSEQYAQEFDEHIYLLHALLHHEEIVGAEMFHVRSERGPQVWKLLRALQVFSVQRVPRPLPVLVCAPDTTAKRKGKHHATPYNQSKAEAELDSTTILHSQSTVGPRKT